MRRTTGSSRTGGLRSARRGYAASLVFIGLAGCGDVVPNSNLDASIDDGQTSVDASIDAGLDPCHFATTADFCDDFDLGVPFARWAPPQYRGVSSGVDVATVSPASAPAHARIMLPASTTATGQLAAFVLKELTATDKRVRFDFDYRLDTFTAPGMAAELSGGVLSLQRQQAGVSQVTVQVEVFGLQSEAYAPRLRLRLYQGTTLIGGQAFVSDAVALRTWQHLSIDVETNSTSSGVFVTVRRDDASLLDRTEFPVTIMDGDVWEARIGGFTGGNPATHRPAMVQDYDNVAVTLAP